MPKSFDQQFRSIYSPSLISEDHQRQLERIVAPQHWDAKTLRRVMVALTKLGSGNYVPAAYRPESIDLADFRSSIDKLTRMSRKSGVETSQVIFADSKTDQLVPSDNIETGSYDETRFDFSPQTDDVDTQQSVATIHTHLSTVTGHGFSDTDYVSFLNDRSQIMMLVAYEGGVIIALKTTATPNALPVKRLRVRAKQLMDDYYHNAGGSYKESVTELNNAFCVEFGLTLYFAPTKDRNLAKRVEVTK